MMMMISNKSTSLLLALLVAQASSSSSSSSSSSVLLLEERTAVLRGAPATTTKTTKTTTTSSSWTFDEWASKFEREYESVEERGRRLLVWLENHAFIEAHNAEGGGRSFTLGHNEYSDMTHDEFRRRMRLGEYSSVSTSLLEKREFNFVKYDDDDEEEDEDGDDRVAAGAADRLRKSSVASAVERRRLLARGGGEDATGCDWHARGLTGPVRQQGQCGACWAFSAVGAIESAMAIKKYDALSPPERLSSDGGLGLVVPLSEQDLIDCDMRFEKGCEGGLMTTTFEEEETARRGVCSEADYPYLETEGTCSRDACAPVPGSVVAGQVDVVPRKTAALVEALEVQPVTAAMVADDPMFQFYSSGIYQAGGCGKVTKRMGDEDCGILYDDQDVCLPDINHGVLVVGYGTDETATTAVKGYFKVKNSWGGTWGEGGYFRIARWETDKTDPKENWGECAILSLLSYPVME